MGKFPSLSKNSNSILSNGIILREKDRIAPRKYAVMSIWRCALDLFEWNFDGRSTPKNLTSPI